MSLRKLAIKRYFESNTNNKIWQCCFDIAWLELNSFPFYPLLFSWIHMERTIPPRPVSSCGSTNVLHAVACYVICVCVGCPLSLLDLRSVPARDRLPESPPLLSCLECPSWWILSDKPCSFSAMDPPRFRPIDDTVDSFP